MHNMYCVYRNYNLNELQCSVPHDCVHCMMEWTKLVIVAIHSLFVCCVALSQLVQNSWRQGRETALIVASGNGHLETARLLLHRGAVVNHQRRVRVLL